MIILDRLLVGGIKFVLEKVAQAVDAELNDDSALREELLAAQMRLELGEMSPEQFAVFEKDILARLREIRERQRGESAHEPATMKPGEFKVTGVEAETTFDAPGDVVIEAPAGAVVEAPGETRARGGRARAKRRA